MTSYSLIIGKEWVGEFSPPSLPGAFSYKWLCVRCGELVATRYNPQARCWIFTSTICLTCAAAEPVREWAFFRLPYEVIAGFEPLPILAYEFLYNSEYVLQEQAHG